MTTQPDTCLQTFLTPETSDTLETLKHPKAAETKATVEAATLHIPQKAAKIFGLDASHTAIAEPLKAAADAAAPATAGLTTAGRDAERLIPEQVGMISGVVDPSSVHA
jgi:hypothetical protein